MSAWQRWRLAFAVATIGLPLGPLAGASVAQAPTSLREIRLSESPKSIAERLTAQRLTSHREIRLSESPKSIAQRLTAQRLTSLREIRVSESPKSIAERLTYQGGPVLHANRTHVIFWDPAGSGLSFDPGYMALVQQFLADVAADSHMTTNEYAVIGEYGDRVGPAAYASTYAGSVLDTDVLPANGCTEPAQIGPGWSDCLTDAQLEEELEHELGADRLPAGGDNIYFIVTPSGLGSCEDASSSACALGGPQTGYCGYHSSTDSDTLYAVIPYNAVAGHCQSSNPRPNASTADPALSTISHEQAEMITDPLGNAWTDTDGDEIGDVCLNDFGPALGGAGASAWDESINGHHYWLQELYSRIRGRCVARVAPDMAWIAGSGRVRAGTRISFGGHGRMPGGTVDGFLWSLGNALVGSRRVINRVFGREGSYELRLRITDSAGNWAYATRAITVVRARARRTWHGGRA